MKKKSMDTTDKQTPDHELKLNAKILDTLAALVDDPEMQFTDGQQDKFVKAVRLVIADFLRDDDAAVESYRQKVASLNAHLLVARGRIERLEAREKDLEDGLSDLLAEQNGPPLERHRETWQKAFDHGYKLLEK